MDAARLAVIFEGDHKGADRSFDHVEGRVGRFERGMPRVGMALTKTLSVVAGAAALVFRKSFNEWHEGLSAVRVGVGATGAELKRFEGDMLSTAGRVTQGIGDVGGAMAELATRTDLTDKPLQGMTKQILDLERITGEAASGSIPAITRLFGDWSVATEKQADTMDQLFRLSQKSGIELTRLSEQMVQFGSPLRQLGLDFDFSAAMFARFEREGVNVQTLMPGLRMALKNFAKDGREPAEALMETIEAIKETSSVAEANTMAFEVFGVRAGPDMAAAIREGRFELDEYLEAMRGGTDTIGQASDDTLKLTDHIKMFTDRIMGTLGPLGELPGLLSAGAAAVGPMVLGLGMMGVKLSSIGTMLMRGGPVMIGLGLIAAAFNAAKEEQARWTQLQEEWREALLSGTSAAELQARLLDDLRKSHGENAEEAAKLLGLEEKYAEAVNATAISIGNQLRQAKDVPGALSASTHAMVRNLILQGNFTLAQQLIQENVARATEAIEDNAAANHDLERMLANSTRALGGFGGATGEAGEAVKIFAGMAADEFAEWRSAVRADIRDVSGLLSDLAGDSEVTATKIARSFEKQAEAVTDYRANFKELIDAELPDDFLKQLADMGLEGAPIVAELAGANDAMRDRIISAWQDVHGAKGLPIDAFKDAKSSTDDATASTENYTDSIKGIPLNWRTQFDLDSSAARAELKEISEMAKSFGMTFTTGAGGQGGARGIGSGQLHGGGMVPWDLQPRGGDGASADEMLAVVRRGEFYTRPEMVTPKTLPILRAINEGRLPDLPEFHVGGLVGMDQLAGGVDDYARLIKALKVSATLGSDLEWDLAALGTVGGFGRATPNAARYAGAVFSRFPEAQNWGIYNRRFIAGTNTWSQHAYGNAVDVGVGSMALGDAIAAWSRFNAGALNIRNLLWRVAMHYDHVHADFNPPGVGIPPMDQGGLYSVGPGTYGFRVGAGVREDVEFRPRNRGMDDRPMVVNLVVDRETVARAVVRPELEAHDDFRRATARMSRA